MPNTPYMNLALPVVGVTPGGGSGTSWGPLLTASLDTIDAHDHSPGKGAPLSVTAPQFTVESDLGFGGHSLFSIKNLIASGTLTAAALSGSLTQIPLMLSGTVTGTLAAFVGVGGIQVSTNSLGQVLISGSVGDDRYASYVLAQPDAENPNYRVISGSGGLTVVDGGPQGNLAISGTVAAGLYASYLVLAPTARAPNARTLALSGSGVGFIDGGPGSTFTLQDFDTWVDRGNSTSTTGSVSIDSSGRSAAQVGTDVYFFVSGTTGLPVGTPGRMVAVFGGNQIVSGSLHALAGLSIDGTGASLASKGSDIYTWISGSVGLFGPGAKKIVFGGDVVHSGSITAVGIGAGFTGSITQTAQGNPYMIGTGGVSITTNSLGQVIVSGSGISVSDVAGTGGSTVSSSGGDYTVSSSVGADLYASYLLLNPNANDPNAQVLVTQGGLIAVTSGSTFFLKDFDAWLDSGNTINTTSSVSIDSLGISASQIGTDVYLWVSGTIGKGGPSPFKSVFGGDVTSSGSITAAFGSGFTGSLTRTATGNPYLIALGGIGLSTNSLGQISISSSVAPFQSIVALGSISGTTSGNNLTLSGTLGGANFVTALATAQNLTSSANLTSPSITKAKNGIVSVAGMLVVNPTNTTTGSAQLYRDSYTAIGPAMNLLMNVQVPQAFALQWVDILPDTGPHTYAIKVFPTAGNVSVSASQGSITAIETH